MLDGDQARRGSDLALFGPELFGSCAVGATPSKASPHPPPPSIACCPLRFANGGLHRDFRLLLSSRRTVSQSQPFELLFGQVGPCPAFRHGMQQPALKEAKTQPFRAYELVRPMRLCTLSFIASSVMQQLFQLLDVFTQALIVGQFAFNLANCVQDSGVVAIAEAAADFRQRPGSELFC